MALLMSDEQRRERLDRAAERVGGKAELGRKLGYKDGHFVGQMIRGGRPITEKTIRALLAIREVADLFAWHAGTPEGAAIGFVMPANDELNFDPASKPGKNRSQPPPQLAGAQIGVSLDRALSHRREPDEAPLLSWDEVVVGAKINEQFKTILPDGALGQDFPAGTEILWSSPHKRHPKVGRQALVIDEAGQLHARWLGQGARQGELTAVSPSPLYRSFDGATQRFEVVAVFKAKVEPDDG